ncbi:MAG TPA: glutamine--tRNA ligase/YqeY domain fusion protein, partial [Terriglobales bacterium]
MSNSSKDAVANGAPETPATPSNFVRDRFIEDLKTNKYEGRVQTRFPPEPNGYLHIGHAKAICLDFGLADEFGGHTNLRFDDTNPEKEETEYVESIQEDVKWLGFHWEGLYYASDYFDQLYSWAVQLIKADKAYVDDLSAEEIREYRGTLTEPGKESPYRNRSVEESLDLFERMRAGEFPDGTRTLRAKIDMASPNMNMRDPVMYRILHAEHHRTGSKWCIYPMYDYAHGQSDSLERVTHSMCTLEFTDHQPLYTWFIRELGIFPSQQIEFDRLNLTYTLLSKRKLLQLVQEKHVSGWDDPRMPTISGIRRRGYTPEAIRNFCAAVGVSRTNGTTDIAMLEHFVREDLNKHAPRAMAVLRPLKVVIDNYPEGQVEELELAVNPEDEAAGLRKVPFTRELYIEQDDFREVPPPKYFRLTPGREVRLRGGYFITCTNVVKNSAGEVVEIHCTYDPATRSGNAPDGRKVKATIHWVSATESVNAEVRLYDKLFTKPNPNQVEEGQEFTANLNPDSLQVLSGC